MKITNEIKKQKAIELMNKLNIYKPYIHGFETDNKVCFFEISADFGLTKSPNLWQKSKKSKKRIKFSYMPLLTNI